MQTRTIYSPLLIFLLFLVAAEFFVRLPFVLFTLNAPSSGHLQKLHFFSIYTPRDVIALGLILLTVALVFILATNLVTPARIKILPLEIPHVPKGVRLVSITCGVASLIAIFMVGIESLLLSFSSKRSDLASQGSLWVLLKVAHFNHVVILLLYLRYLKYGTRMDQVFMAVSFLTLAAVSLVFSQRAVLMSLILGMFYIALLYGRLRFRTVMQLVFFVGVVIVGISALRPGAEFSSNFEAVSEGLRRAVMSRYFFDFAKLGTVLHWADGQAWLGPAVIGFLFEPFVGDQIVFYKEVGPMISAEVYLYRTETGVTPGLLLESILSFGYLFGIMFFGAVIQAFRIIESRFFTPKGNTLGAAIIPVFILSKFTLALNSSLGAYMFQLLIESLFLFVTLFFLNLFSLSRSTRTAPV